MAVYIACDKCQKRLKIPDNIVGHSIKCPACNTVFKADPARVQPAAQPIHTAALAEDDEVRPVRQKVAPVEETDQVEPKPRKKVALPDDEDEVVPAGRPPARDDDDEPRRARRRRPADYDDEDEEYDDERADRKGRTPWYVTLPLLVLSFCAVGLAILWPLGFSWLTPALDRGLTLSFEGRMWVGIVAAIVLTLLCLVVSLISARGWLRFLVVVLLLAIAYGGSFAAAYWWKDLPFGKEEKKEPVRLPPQLQNLPPDQ